MASVTGFTAERMLAMEAATIVDGDIVGDNLILTRHDGATINAGNVRGPTGLPGITNAEMLQHLPAGVIVDWIGTAAPTKWLGMTGQQVVSGRTLYPDLWAVLPSSMKHANGDDIVMPNTKGKVSVGLDTADTDFDTIGKTGGAKTVTLTQAQLPAASITIDPPATTVSVNPPSTPVTGSVGYTDLSHWHFADDTDLAAVFVVQDSGNGGPHSIDINAGTGNTVHTSSHTRSVILNHTHDAGTLAVDIAPFNITVDIASFNSGNLGSGQAHNNVQPYITFMKIIKAA